MVRYSAHKQDVSDTLPTNKRLPWTIMVMHLLLEETVYMYTTNRHVWAGLCLLVTRHVLQHSAELEKGPSKQWVG